MKSLVKFAAVAAAGALALAGCGSGGGSDKSGDAPVKLVFWQHTYTARDNVVKDLAKQFEAAHPGVTVDLQFIPYDQYFDKLVTGLKAGTGPDVFQVPEEMSEQLIKAKTVAALPDSVATTASIDADYSPATVGRWKSDGKYYGLPTDVETVLLYANTDLLKACGGDPANLPKTWAQLTTQAQACTKKDAAGNITQAGLDTRYKWALYTQAQYSMSATKVYDPASCSVNLTDPSVVAAWQTATSFATGPKAVDSPAFLTGQKKFENGKAVFYINHPVTIGTLATFPDVHYVAGPAPTADGTPGSLVHSWAYVVSAKSKHADLAWQWDKFLTDANAQKTWFTKTGSLPATKSTLADTSLATTQPQQAALASLAGAKEVTTVAQKPDDITDATWDAIVTGHTDVAKALGDAQNQIKPQVSQALDC